MKYVEGYTSDEVCCCPFCGHDNMTHHVQVGFYTCCECKRRFAIVKKEVE